MNVSYQLTRTDVAKGNLYLFKYSPQLRQTFFVGLLVILGIVLLWRYGVLGGKTGTDDIILPGVLLGGYLIGLPLASILLPSLEKRSQIIKQAGIETRIGSRNWLTRWQDVEDIVTTDEYVILIVRNPNTKNLNAFTIPLRAFSSKEQSSNFVQVANEYRRTK